MPVVSPEAVQDDQDVQSGAVHKGEHARFEDFPEIKLTEAEEEDFNSRIAVVCGSITDPEKLGVVQETMELWGKKGVDLFLSDRPFRVLKDGDELAAFDNLTAR